MDRAMLLRQIGELQGFVVGMGMAVCPARVTLSPLPGNESYVCMKEAQQLGENRMSD